MQNEHKPIKIPPAVRKQLQGQGIKPADVLSWKQYPTRLVVVLKNGQKLALAVQNEPA